MTDKPIQENGEEVEWTGATSFEQLDAEQAAEKRAESIRELVEYFGQMVRNIMYDPSLPNKEQALQIALDGLVRRVRETPSGVEEMGEALLVESAADVVLLSEDEMAPRKPGGAWLRAQIIVPGFGNKKDGHYYGKDMLRECAPVFVGAKMYETDHDEKAKSTKTWVSTITEVQGFTQEGAPIGLIYAHDPSFADRLRNLSEQSLLGKMECSIHGGGRVKTGKVGGESVPIVEAITYIKSVDWVTAAGAGGKALELVENEDGGATTMVDIVTEAEEPVEVEEQETVEVAIHESDDVATLNVSDIVERLIDAPLCKASRQALAAGEYTSVEELELAIADQVEFENQVRESIGKPAPVKAPKVEGPAPIHQGSAQPVAVVEALTPEAKAKAESDILRRAGALG